MVRNKGKIFFLLRKISNKIHILYKIIVKTFFYKKLFYPDSTILSYSGNVLDVYSMNSRQINCKSKHLK